MARKTLCSGIIRCEWTGNCYSYEDRKGRIVNIQKSGKRGWVSSWINPPEGVCGPFYLPSVGSYRTLTDAFYSSIALFCH